MISQSKLGSIRGNYKYKLNYRLLFLLFAFFCSESYLLLIKRGSIVYSFSSGLVLLWGVIEEIRIHDIRARIYKSRAFIIAFGFFIIISIIQACRINGEPIVYAIIGASGSFAVWLYFPIRYIVNKYGHEMIAKGIANFGCLVSALLIIQWIVYPRIVFIHSPSSARLGHYRTYYFMTITIFSILFYLSRVFARRFTKKEFIGLVINTFAFVFVQQTKGAIFAVVLSCGIVFLFDINKGKTVYKVLVIFTLVIVLVLARGFVIQMLDETLDVINEAQTTITGNVGIRIKTIEYLMNSIKGHEMFGLGYYSGKWSKTDYITGWAYNYASGDVGFFGHIFHVGYVGFGLSILFLVSMGRTIGCINRKSSFYFFGKMLMLYFVFVAIFNYYFTSLNLLFYLMVYTALFEEAELVDGEKNNRSHNRLCNNLG